MSCTDPSAGKQKAPKALAWRQQFLGFYEAAVKGDRKTSDTGKESNVVSDAAPLARNGISEEEDGIALLAPDDLLTNLDTQSVA